MQHLTFVFVDVNFASLTTKNCCLSCKLRGHSGNDMQGKTCRRGGLFGLFPSYVFGNPAWFLLPYQQGVRNITYVERHGLGHLCIMSFL